MYQPSPQKPSPQKPLITQKPHHIDTADENVYNRQEISEISKGGNN